MYTLNFGCWRSPDKKSQHNSPPLDFDTREKAIAVFERKKEKLKIALLEPWNCSIISPEGNIEKLK